MACGGCCLFGRVQGAKGSNEVPLFLPKEPNLQNEGSCGLKAAHVSKPTYLA